MTSSCGGLGPVFAWPTCNVWRVSACDDCTGDDESRCLPAVSGGDRGVAHGATRARRVRRPPAVGRRGDCSRGRQLATRRQHSQLCRNRDSISVHRISAGCVLSTTLCISLVPSLDWCGCCMQCIFQLCMTTALSALHPGCPGAGLRGGGAAPCPEAAPRRGLRTSRTAGEASCHHPGGRQCSIHANAVALIMGPVSPQWQGLSANCRTRRLLNNIAVPHGACAHWMQTLRF